MRLLMVSSDTGVVAGRKGAFWNTLRGFHRYWDRIDVICPHVDEPVCLTAFGNVHFHPLPRTRLRVPLDVLRVGRRLCREQRPDLIAAHSYGFQRMALGGLLLARRTKVPLVVEVHLVEGFPRTAGVVDALRRRAYLLFFRLASRTARAFRVVNQAELTPILKACGVPGERILPLYAIYLDRSIFHPGAERKVHDMVFVGRLVRNKGIATLLDTYEQVLRDRPEATFLIVGRGPLESWLHDAVRDRGLTGVRHVRWADMPDLADLYRQSRVVVCASYSEGGPRFTLEAMACGVPAVSTPVGLMHEILGSGDGGRLTSSWSSAELANEVGRLLDDDDLYRRTSEQAARTGERFDYARTIREYALAYHEVARG